jgi:pimeloyl-ACP methyl ester carboxylesterase
MEALMEHRIDTPVGPLAVRVEGHGQPAILWHSLFVDDRSWDRLASRLEGERQLVIITGPGHGTSGDPGRRYSIDECAYAARLVLEALAITQPVDWVGNAWGGHVGATAAARWPTMIRSLVMLGTPIASLTLLERARTYLLLALYRVVGPSGAVVNATTSVLLSPRTRTDDPEAVQLVESCLRAADRRMLRNAIVSISLRRTELSETLRHVTQPTLILTGTQHHGFTAEQARAGARLLERGQVAVVPDAAYLVSLEAPGVCARLVHNFWAAQGASATP